MKCFELNATGFVILVIALNCLWVDCRRSIGSSRRTSSSSRTYSRNVPTSKTPVYTSGGSNNNYYGNTYQRKASNVGTTPRYVVKTQPTVRYQQVTQKPVYTQQSGYTPRPAYQQPVYTQRPVYTQQASYPKQPYHQQNYPNFNQPTVRPYGGYGSNFGNNYYNPSGGYHKKDHSVRNSVLAGLGGSALGMYLGYKLGSFTSDLNNPHRYGGMPGGYGGYGAPAPQYSVVHHYHHGDKPIYENAVVEPNVITPCKDVNICTPNTTPLCMNNGTIYCVAPTTQTSMCNVNSTMIPCVNATISAPCLNATDGNCNSTELTTQNLEIPCVSSINVFGDFNTNRLSVQSEGAATSNNGQGALTSQGINNKYCVTIIAEPLVEPKNLSNEEYVRYLNDNPYAKEEAGAKVGNIMNQIGGFMFS